MPFGENGVTTAREGNHPFCTKERLEGLTAEKWGYPCRREGKAISKKIIWKDFYLELFFELRLTSLLQKLIYPFPLLKE